MPKLFVFVLCNLFLMTSAASAAETVSSANPEYRQWIEDMKVSDRGPFARIRWFCSDGSVLPPRPYACKDHGGGFQHGEWNEQATQLRDQKALAAGSPHPMTPLLVFMRQQAGAS